MESVPNLMEEPLVTTAATARAIGVSIPTINRWRSLGIISPVVEIGATVRWNITQVIEGLQAHHDVIPKRFNPKVENLTSR